MNLNSSITLSALAVAGALSIGSCVNSAKTETANSEPQEIFCADPTIFVENGKYYLTGTDHGDTGFQLLESTDLENWTYVKGDSALFVLQKGDNVFGNKGFWAPQIYKEDGKYYMFYTANEQVAVAKSDSLTGPYVQERVRPIDGSEKNIDPFLFRDDDGKYYLYHVRFDHGNFLWCGEYDMATDSVDTATLVQCFKNTDPWEKTDDGRWDPIMEGMTVFKLDGVYYMTYSANHFLNPDYAVGVATAPSPKGPWTKYAGNPVIHRNIVGENGSGHGDLFTGLDGRPYYVYHVHYSDTVVSPRRTRIVPLNFNKNEETGVYDISVDSDSVIVPHIVK